MPLVLFCPEWFELEQGQVWGFFFFFPEGISFKIVDIQTPKRLSFSVTENQNNFLQAPKIVART